MTVNVYLEGGPLLRPAMKAFLLGAVNAIHHQSVVLNVIPCGSGDDAIRKCRRDSNAVLLVDSEGVLTTQLADRVAGQVGGDNSAFFMVQLMEAWFLADRPTLGAYYGATFNAGRLPGNPNIEDIPKPDVERGLRNATRRCSKGAYNKTTHAPRLLELINPPAVYNACPNFARLIDFLRGQDPD
ncbi:MAG: DUF4276 family protein [Dehalococcoidia bacterium]|nr:DUF4276 family protein [Dehalococcoidia bacterium]